jgi:L-lactate dehydrogenase complex protein LldG
MAKAKRVVSFLQGVDQANVDLNLVTDPHTLEDVDVTLVQGQFGVAENAAVWIQENSPTLRASLFICQHLVILLPERDIIDNMHKAYERIGSFSPGFGVFVSGPSKTADIEQSLVIGAHGARSATLYLLQNGR